ncbi:MAG: NB-ARC domain-containing protein [Phormidesmis sp.]
MPQLSTSPRVRARIRILLKKLLECADLGMAAQTYASDLFEYRWIDELSSRPKLVIKTKLSFLAELIASESATTVSKGHIREVLLVLQKKLDILEDNRIKTRGSDIWDFTLKLWDTSVDKNLRKFDQAWAQYKASQGSRLTEMTPTLSRKLIQTAQQQQRLPLHNLTLRPDSYFIDTQNVLLDLCSTLSAPYSDAIISIVGPGGIGKTTLALEVAYRCLAAVQQRARTGKLPTFEAIVFASAQSQEFLGPHLSERWQTDRTLKDIIREILRTLDYADGMPFQLDAQIEFVYGVLKNYKTLLILDNLETTENPRRLLSFVRSLPQSVKVILTSRTRFGIGKTISLDYLPAEPSFSLIEHKAKKKLVQLRPEQTQEIYQLSGGLPLAIAYSVGYLAVYNKLPELGPVSTAQQPSEMARYCVEASLKQLKNKLAYQLLIAAALFAGKFSTQAANYIAGLPHGKLDSSQELSSLYRLSLVNKIDSRYYVLHPLTQEFARSELKKDSAFKEAAYSRWSEWYLQLLAPLADGWLDWQDYSELEPEWSNVRALVDWCIEHKAYDTFRQLWRGLRGYTLMRGYWDERQAWMDGLMQMADARGDKQVLAQAMFYQGQTLMHIDETDSTGQALKLFEQSWTECAQDDADIKFASLAYIAARHLKKNEFDIAKDWLERRSNVQHISLANQKQQQCIYFYYVGEIALRQEKYQAAEDSYRKALALADALQWKKMIAYNKAWLGYTLSKKRAFDEANSCIESCLSAAKHYQDKRSIAQCYYFLADSAREDRRLNDFRRWATLAQDEFEKLGIAAMANQMKQWMEEI